MKKNITRTVENLYTVHFVGQNKKIECLLAVPSLELVQWVQLHPSILSKGCMHPSSKENAVVFKNLASLGPLFDKSDIIDTLFLTLSK